MTKDSNQYSETFETWNKVALQYQEKFMKLELYNGSYDFVCGLLSHNAKVLDVGCGPGNIASYLLSKQPDLQLEGIDVAPAMVDLAAKNNPSATFSVLDVRHLDTLKAKYDAVICGFCLPYLSETDAATFFRNVAQLLNKNGVLYLSFVPGNQHQSGFQSGSSGLRVYFYYHQPAIVKGLLASAGFKLIRTFEVKYKNSANGFETHSVLIAKKK